MSNPEDPFKSLQREAERLFHDLVYRRHPASHFVDHPWAPSADLVVTKSAARVLFELAGVPRDSIGLRLVGRVLEVSGRRAPPQETPGANYHRAEIYFGEFRRLVELPWDADPGKVEAIYKEGMLEVRLKRVPAPERTEISIEGDATAARTDPRGSH